MDVCVCLWMPVCVLVCVCHKLNPGTLAQSDSVHCLGHLALRLALWIRTACNCYFDTEAFLWFSSSTLTLFIFSYLKDGSSDEEYTNGWGNPTVACQMWPLQTFICILVPFEMLWQQSFEQIVLLWSWVAIMCYYRKAKFLRHVHVLVELEKNCLFICIRIRFD